MRGRPVEPTEQFQSDGPSRILRRVKDGEPLDHIAVIDSHTHMLHDGGQGVGFMPMPNGDADHIIARNQRMGIERFMEEKESEPSWFSVRHDPLGARRRRRQGIATRPQRHRTADAACRQRTGVSHVQHGGHGGGHLATQTIAGEQRRGAANLSKASMPKASSETAYAIALALSQWLALSPGIVVALMNCVIVLPRSQVQELDTCYFGLRCHTFRFLKGVV